jgi:hypothetical protein
MQKDKQDPTSGLASTTTQRKRRQKRQSQQTLRKLVKKLPESLAAMKPRTPQEEAELARPSTPEEERARLSRESWAVEPAQLGDKLFHQVPESERPRSNKIHGSIISSSKSKSSKRGNKAGKPPPQEEEPDQAYNPILDDHGLDKSNPLTPEAKKLAEELGFSERDVYRLVAMAWRL